MQVIDGINMGQQGGTIRYAPIRKFGKCTITLEPNITNKITNEADRV